MLRVFSDRLVNDVDQKHVFKMTYNAVKTHLKEDFDELFSNLTSTGDRKVVADDLGSLMFCDFADPQSDKKDYSEVTNIGNLKDIAEGYRRKFNNLGRKSMDIVLTG